jgi:hypothetical protein
MIINIPSVSRRKTSSSGMLVQKRTLGSDSRPSGAPVPTIRVKVKFAGVTHEVYVNSQASFGELKKLMS